MTAPGTAGAVTHPPRSGAPVPGGVRLLFSLASLGLLAVLLVIIRWQVAPPSAVVLDLGNPETSASHFYGVEQSTEYAFRWSRELSAVSLPALASSQVVSLTINPARPAGETPPKVYLRVGGELVGEIAPQPGWHTYAVTIGPGPAPDVRLVLESNTFYPGAGDRRRLGVAVSQIAAMPAQGTRPVLLPPFLWLLLALITPMLAFWTTRLLGGSRSIGSLAAASACIIPALWSAFAPTTIALPVFAWAVGTLAALCLPAHLYKLPMGSMPFVQRLSSWAHGWRELLLVGLAAMLLALMATWPLAGRMFSQLPGWPGDNFAFLYKIWWFRTALLDLHMSPFFDPGSYAPFGFSLGQGEPTLANTLTGVPIAALTNDVFAYNLLALLSFPVSAVGGYLLVKELTGSRLAALLGGVAFAFCPYRLSQFAGHLQMLGTGWIALSFYFLERLLKMRRMREGIYLGVSLGLAAMSAWYYAYMVALALGAFVALRLLLGYGLSALPRLVRPLLAGIVVFLVIASPVAVPSLQLWAGGNLSHSAKAADEHSAAPADYLIPNPLQPVWGELGMRAHAEQNVIESALYLGLPVVLIAAAGWWTARRKEAVAVRRGRTAWLLLALLCFVLSLGLTLHDDGGQVKFGAEGAALPMPGRLLYDWLPLYSSMRAFARFGVLVMLAVVVLMGMGWAALLRWGPRWVRIRPLWSTGLAALLILADFWSGPYAWGTSRVEAGEAARYLAQQPPGLVMRMPLSSSQSGPALYDRVFYGKPLAYGYETFEPPQWRDARPALLDFPSDRALDVLAGWGVRYIVVSGNAYGADWPGTLDYLKSLPRLHFLTSSQERTSWLVDPLVLDARPDMEEYAAPDTPAVFELVR